MSNPFTFEPLANGAAEPETIVNDNFGKAKTKFDELDNTLAGGVVEEAPNDGKSYTRTSKAWAEIVLPEPETGDFITEAPNDGKLYGRKSEAWAEVPANTGGGGTSSSLLKDRINNPPTTTFPTILGTDGKNPVLTAPSATQGLRLDYGVKHSGTGDHVRGVVKPATKGKDYIFRLLCDTPLSNFNQVGVILRNSANGKLITAGRHYSDAIRDLSFLAWDGPTTYNSQLLVGRALRPNQQEWVKIRLDATTMHYMVSTNGKDWARAYNTPYNGFIGDINQIGLFIQVNDQGWDNGFNSFPYTECLYYEEVTF